MFYAHISEFGVSRSDGSFTVACELRDLTNCSETTGLAREELAGRPELPGSVGLHTHRLRCPLTAHERGVSKERVRGPELRSNTVNEVAVEQTPRDAGRRVEVLEPAALSAP